MTEVSNYETLPTLQAVRDFIKKYIDDSYYYQLICTTGNCVAWVGKRHEPHRQ
jgi:hypothetical protein